jgi:glutaredoxin
LGRPGCSLCDAARAVIERVRARHPLELVEVNIDDDPELRAEYDADVPVVEVNDREVARHRITEERLDGALRMPTKA